MIRQAATILFVTTALCGCSGDVFQGAVDAGDGAVSSDGVNNPHVLAAIYISPLNKILEVDLNKPATLKYSAKGAYQDSKEEDLTQKVTWKSSNPKVGSFKGAVGWCRLLGSQMGRAAPPPTARWHSRMGAGWAGGP